jgi:hypothetical protein
MKKLPLLSIVLVLALASMQSCKKEAVSPLEGEKYATFRTDMRILWSDHAVWTRNVIINLVDDAPGTTEAVNRLLKNQEDIGNAIKPYYGDAGGEALTDLLKTHITTAADILTAAKNGNTGAYDIALAAWYVNADDIATFLNTANPEQFGLADWKAMMKSHLDHTLAEAVARLTGDYAADVAAYDAITHELQMMADMLAEGIALQHPDKF